eukprot:1150504-Pelagomonas_calceolata.AAC.1
MKSAAWGSGDLEVLNSTPSGNNLKLVGVHKRMSMKLASPANTQKDSMKSYSFCTNEFVEVCMLPVRRLQLLSRPRVFTVLHFNQVHMPLVCIQLVRLPHAVSYAGPPWGAMPAA